MLTLRKRVQGPWEQMRQSLWEDLVTIETTLNTKWAIAFGPTNIVNIKSVPVIDTAHGGTGQTTYNKGDLLVGNPTASLDRLPVGADATVLTADSTQPDGIKWAAIAAQAQIVSYVSLRIL